MPFEDILKYTKEDDFVYFDPPYYPLIKGRNFTTYTKDNFLEKEQRRLFEVFKELSNRRCKLMLSNSDTELIKGLYKDFNIGIVKAKRMINCNGSGRGEINEIVITNYLVQQEEKQLNQPAIMGGY